MLTVKAAISRFAEDRRAVTALEYALIAGLIAIVIVGAVSTIGTKMTDVFQKVGSAISSA